MNLTVIGGDRRAGALAGLLSRRGHRVRTWGLEQADTGNAERCGCLRRALEDTGGVILPLPSEDGAGNIPTPLGETPVSAQTVLSLVRPGTPVYAGKPGEAIREGCTSGMLPLTDYLDREAVTVANAALTAEGAVGLLLEHSGFALLGMEVLVLGFGRVGKLTAHRLHAMGALVTVWARGEADRRWAEAYGMAAAGPASPPDYGRFGAVVNTVPVPVLEESALARLRGDCVLLELASAPGGFPLSRQDSVLRAPGLPGKTAPLAAAEILCDALETIFREEGME